MCAVSQRGTAASSAPVRRRLADIVRAHGPTYRATHRLARVQAAAFRAIETCRTAVLGGHREACARCGATRIRYNSCRNRHCPKCQGLAQARWLAARRAELLPIPYFHVVFTLPHALNALAPGNPRVIYTLLFRAAADTLLTFGRDSRHLGGTIGVTAILHTWGQNLSQHLQVHCLVTGGALAPDRGHWIPPRAPRSSSSAPSPSSSGPSIWPASNGPSTAGSSPSPPARPTWQIPPPSPACSTASVGRTGSSTRSGPSPAPPRSSPASGATPTASR